MQNPLQAEAVSSNRKEYFISIHSSLQTEFTQRTTTTAFNQTQKKDAALAELISDVSSPAASHVSQIFGLCAALSPSAGLPTSVWAKVKTGFKCGQSWESTTKE